jgi:hypothetical protein
VDREVKDVIIKVQGYRANQQCGEYVGACYIKIIFMTEEQ